MCHFTYVCLYSIWIIENCVCVSFHINVYSIWIIDESVCVILCMCVQLLDDNKPCVIPHLCVVFG